MQNRVQYKEKGIRLLFAVIISLIAMKCQFSTRIGDSSIRFSLFPCFALCFPLFVGFSSSLPSFYFTSLFSSASFSSFIAFFRLPTLAGFLFFHQKTPWILLLPLSAMVIFNCDPEARKVWYYSLYWLIPVVCYFYRDRSLFIKSLGSTFVTHAVGSIIHMQFRPMTSSQWQMLVPMVFIERFYLALGICVMIKISQGVVHFIDNKVMPLVKTTSA